MLSINCLTGANCSINCESIEGWESRHWVIDKKSDLRDVIVGINSFWVSFAAWRCTIRMFIIPGSWLKVHSIDLRKSSGHRGCWSVRSLLLNDKGWCSEWTIKISISSRNWTRENQLNPPTDSFTIRVKTCLGTRRCNQQGAKEDFQDWRHFIYFKDYRESPIK